ncbi:MAG TPA: hypothetical protein VJT75_03370 [Thermoleophilaceae bacterium]|nr:hypothetical protein [Thermoleophilaceae bacterium]
MTRLRRFGLSVAAAVGLGALLAAVALAATPTKGRYTGQSEQVHAPDHGVELRVDKQHKVARFAIDWRAFCKKPDQVWDAGTEVENPKNDPIGTFHDHGTYTSKTTDGFTGKITLTVDGRFTDKTHARGDWKATVKVFNPKGKRVDTCKVKTGWTAHPA